MPYIKQSRRKILATNCEPENAGELNFVISEIVDAFIQRKGGISYATLNEAIGALECAKMEMYRRIASPYEDKKIIENGEVYNSAKSLLKD